MKCSAITNSGGSHHVILQRKFTKLAMELNVRSFQVETGLRFHNVFDSIVAPESQLVSIENVLQNLCDVSLTSSGNHQR